MNYYKLRNGKIYSEHDLETAFEIIQDVLVCDCRTDYAVWKRSVLLSGNAVSVDIDTVPIDKDLVLNNKAIAINAYRIQNNTTLREAKHVIDAVYVVYSEEEE